MYGPGVELLKLYLPKLNEANERLFQTPKQHVSKNDSTWYRNEPMGKNTLGNLLQTISKDAKLSQVYTCHSVRATTVTTLHEAGVSEHDIINVTKHKKTTSLSHYISGMPTSQKRKCSDILKTAMAPAEGAAEVEAPDEAVSAADEAASWPISKRSTADATSVAPVTAGTRPYFDLHSMEGAGDKLSASNALAALLPNATFHGSCVINVNLRQ